MVYSEQDLTNAIALYERGGESLRKLSLEFGIPRTTLTSRITGTQRRQDAFEPYQSLSRVQEERLTAWVLAQVALGNPPPHAQIREFARRILLAQGHPQPWIGKDWMARFIRRNPILRTQRARQIDSVRVNGATGAIIQAWWPYLRVPLVIAILPANRYNMDEFGLMEGQGLNGLVVGCSHTRAVQRKTPGSRAWTSFIECISATGSALPPAVIFKGKSVQQQWFSMEKDNLRTWLFTATDKGWINQAVALEWLEKIFIPLTQPDDPTQQRLLVLDGHNSHTTVEFMWLCHSNNIHVLYLPAHTSHVLQPLDLLVFSPLKHSYRKYLNQLNNWSESTVLGKMAMVQCVQKARHDALTSQNIKAGWKATGLWPVNMAKPLMSRLLLENSNQAPKKGPHSQPQPSPHTPRTHGSREAVDSAVVGVISTPRKRSDLRKLLDPDTFRNLPPPTQRLALWKVQKSWDANIFDQTHLQQRFEAQEVQLELARPSKRKKVVPDPNSLFVDIEQIHQAQIEAGRAEESPDEESDSERSEREASCIVVG